MTTYAYLAYASSDRRADGELTGLLARCTNAEVTMSLEFGCCPCGSIYVRREVEVTLKIEGNAVSLKSVPQGACPECGSRVYKAATLRCIESLMKQHEFRLD